MCLCVYFFCFYKYSAGLGNLAQATVAGLPPKTIGPTESKEIPKAEVLPPHTTPGPDFAKEVGWIYVLTVKFKFQYDKIG